VPYFPAGTVFVAVVDPEVGTGRRILAARYNDRIVVAPDNGLLSLLHRDGELQEMRVVESRRFFANTLSATFHGRDIFAPVAAHISAGVSLDHFGPPADHVEILEMSRPRTGKDGTIKGEVFLIDHFGNLITNISSVDLSAARTGRHHLEVAVGPHHIGPIRHTYADVKPGERIALISSSQMLEIAVNSGNAAEILGASRGTSVTLR
jgi:S-adenosylmethionine hydrolase